VLKRQIHLWNLLFYVKLPEKGEGAYLGGRESEDKQEKLQWVRRHTGVGDGGKRNINEGREEKRNNSQGVISFEQSIN
jgi:hypothetical protein